MFKKISYLNNKIVLQNRFKLRFRRVQSTTHAAKNYAELAKWEKDFSLIGWENLTLFEEYLEMGK